MEGWQRAFVLHGRPYSETSLMLDLFTEESWSGACAGKRRAQPTFQFKGCLQPFTPLISPLGRSWGSQNAAQCRSRFLWRFPFLASCSTAACMSTNWCHASWNMNQLLVLFFDYLTLFAGVAAETVHPNRHCVGSNWRCSVILAMASISCIVLGAGKTVDESMTYRYREEKGLSPVWSSIIPALPVEISGAGRA